MGWAVGPPGIRKWVAEVLIRDPKPDDSDDGEDTDPADPESKERGFGGDGDLPV